MKRIIALATLVALSACSEQTFQTTPEQHAQAVADWQQARADSLTSESGWLTLVGLCWLQPGENTFGSSGDAGCEIDYAGMPERLGRFERVGDAVMFTAHDGIDVTTDDGLPVKTIDMIGDHHEGTTMLAHGSLRFYMIERFGELGIRVRDLDSPERRNFRGLDYFPIDIRWRKVARFEPWPEPRGIPIINILGMRDDMRSPGELVFEHEGREYRLTALADEGDSKWFIMIADETSGRSTYGAGRYIYVDPPADGHVLLDLNRLYNPPCAFTELATCPLPPLSNRLSLAITAGEKDYASESGWKAPTSGSGE